MDYFLVPPYEICGDKQTRALARQYMNRYGQAPSDGHVKHPLPASAVNTKNNRGLSKETVTLLTSCLKCTRPCSFTNIKVWRSKFFALNPVLQGQLFEAYQHQFMRPAGHSWLPEIHSKLHLLLCDRCTPTTVHDGKSCPYCDGSCRKRKMMDSDIEERQGLKFTNLEQWLIHFLRDNPYHSPTVVDNPFGLPLLLADEIVQSLPIQYIGHIHTCRCACRCDAYGHDGHRRRYGCCDCKRHCCPDNVPYTVRRLPRGPPGPSGYNEEETRLLSDPRIIKTCRDGAKLGLQCPVRHEKEIKLLQDLKMYMLLRYGTTIDNLSEHYPLRIGFVEDVEVECPAGGVVYMRCPGLEEKVRRSSDSRVAFISRYPQDAITNCIGGALCEAAPFDSNIWFDTEKLQNDLKNMSVPDFFQQYSAEVRPEKYTECSTNEDTRIQVVVGIEKKRAVHERLTRYLLQLSTLHWFQTGKKIGMSDEQLLQGTRSVDAMLVAMSDTPPT